MLYVSLELSSEVLTLDANVTERTLAVRAPPQSSLFERVADVDIEHPQISSEIACSADGRHLYVANRGRQSSIALFHIDANSARCSGCSSRTSQ